MEETVLEKAIYKEVKTTHIATENKKIFHENKCYRQSRMNNQRTIEETIRNEPDIFGNNSDFGDEYSDCESYNSKISGSRKVVTDEAVKLHHEPDACDICITDKHGTLTNVIITTNI